MYISPAFTKKIISNKKYVSMVETQPNSFIHFILQIYKYKDKKHLTYGCEAIRFSPTNQILSESGEDRFKPLNCFECDDIRIIEAKGQKLDTLDFVQNIIETTEQINPMYNFGNMWYKKVPIINVREDPKRLQELLCTLNTNKSTLKDYLSQKPILTRREFLSIVGAIRNYQGTTYTKQEIDRHLNEPKLKN